jgi:hypothetical protein
VSGEGYARIPLDIELETMPDAEEDLDQELALECDKTLHVQDKKANILIGFAIGLGSAAIASLLAVLLHFVSWA